MAEKETVPIEEQKETVPTEEQKETVPTEDNEQPSFKETIESIKTTYEDKIAKLNEVHKKELEERNEVIKQLLTGNETVDTITEDAASISEKINRTRNYEF